MSLCKHSSHVLRRIRGGERQLEMSLLIWPAITSTLIRKIIRTWMAAPCMTRWPFYGVAHIGYIPGKDGHVTGLSKLARLADGFAKRPQVQERLTRQIADALTESLQAQSVIVVIECEHLCMGMRGVK